ncbi:hypothetical protein AA313_de0202224 [Arthrobotrys entomopaga]|nr:hypothetical protein AA313_de0202224 [Arthrobotrys entomopaga]
MDDIKNGENARWIGDCQFIPKSKVTRDIFIFATRHRTYKTNFYPLHLKEAELVLNLSFDSADIEDGEEFMLLPALITTSAATLEKLTVWTPPQVRVRTLHSILVVFPHVTTLQANVNFVWPGYSDYFEELVHSFPNIENLVVFYESMDWWQLGKPRRQCRQLRPVRRRPNYMKQFSKVVLFERLKKLRLPWPCNLAKAYTAWLVPFVERLFGQLRDLEEVVFVRHEFGNYVGITYKLVGDKIEPSQEHAVQKLEYDGYSPR